MKINRIFLFALFLLLVFYANESIAQCALCRANAESDLQNGGSTAKGLNAGILYLMGIPYLILGTLFFLFFKKQILQKINAFKRKFQSA